MNVVRYSIVCSLAALASPALAVHTDIQVQNSGGKVVIGAAQVTDGTFETLGFNLNERAFKERLSSLSRAANPGFNSLATGNVALPAGVDGFAGGTLIEFDLVTFNVGSLVTNLAFWDGIGEVNFGPAPANTRWEVIDYDFNTFDVFGGDTMVPGGLAAPVSSTGRMHEHVSFGVDSDGNVFQNSEPPGVYLSSMQLRVDGYESSDPFFFVHYSRVIDNSVGDTAQQWVRDNYAALTAQPGDFNGDGLVDAADYTVWRDDFDAGNATAGGYDTWVAAYDGNAATAQSVPEPAGVVMLLAALVAAGSPRRMTR